MGIVKKVAARCGHCLKFFFMPAHGLLWQIMMTISEDYGFAKSAADRSCVDKNGSPVPWYTYPAIEFLSQFCYRGLSVFEYGSGNSTLYWSERAEHVTSVEHNPQWFNQMQRVYTDRGNVSCILQTDSGQYVSSLSQKYDIIVIDANWRDACSACALQYIKEGGMIIIDDTERSLSDPEYQRALKLLEDDPRFIRVDFSGFEPLVDYTKTTTVFLTRDFKIPNKEQV